MTTSRCTLLPEVLPERSDSAHTGSCLSDRDFDPMGSLDYPTEPGLPGKAMEEQSSPANGEPQYYMQVSAKDGQLLSPIVGAYAKQRYGPAKHGWNRVLYECGGEGLVGVRGKVF